MTNTAVTIHQGGRRDVEDSPKADRRARSKDLWFPTGSQTTGFAEGGGLLQYGPDIRDMFRRAAVKALRHKSWVAYAKKPFASADHVLDYLGRYTHRVALSNNRICSVHNSEVTFSYRDRKKQNQLELMKLDAHEFIRRFLLHVIPKGFVRVRHFGFLANRSKGLLSKCRKLLDLDPIVPKLSQRSVHEMMLQLIGIDISRCPLCQKGTLVFLANLPVPAPWDSS